MRRVVFAVGFAAALLFHLAPARAVTCVAFVRNETGFGLTGDAWRWWAAAREDYWRGHQPEPGAVIVFAPTPQMRLGHVAVVRAVKGSRKILIDQANWGTGPDKGEIETAVPLIDVSPRNDWSEVRVEWARTGTFGRVNPVNGFIYGPRDARIR